MQTLFAISMLCFLVLVVAGIAIVRYFRRSHRRSKVSAETQHDFSQHFFQALENYDAHPPQMVRQQSVKEITANKTWNSPSKLIEIAPAAGKSALLGKRKAPQPARPAAEERLDWAYFNKDFGDLTNPYQPHRVRVRSSAKSTSNGRA